MNSVIKQVTFREGERRFWLDTLFFLLTTYGIIMVNNSLTVSWTVGYLYGTNYCNIGQINRQVKVNYMMIIMMIHDDPKNFNFICVVYQISNTRLWLKYRGILHENKLCVEIYLIPDFA